MNYYSINQVSSKLSISKDTLRYYDKIGLVCPFRGENKYRQYSEIDLLELQYIETMKYGDFSLAEIKTILINKRSCTGEHLDDTVNLLHRKKIEITKKITFCHDMLKLLTAAEHVLEQKKEPGDTAQINKLIQKIYDDLKGDTHEK